MNELSNNIGLREKETCTNASGDVIEPDDVTQAERKNQLQRRLNKKKKRNDFLSNDQPKSNSKISLDSLVQLSPLSEEIFKLLEQLDVPNGNPLLGMRILLRLPEDLQREYYRLIHFPTLIIESLLMNQQLIELTTVVKDVSEVMRFKLLSFYTEKALKFPDFPKHLMPGKSCAEWRQNHKYKDASTLKDANYTIYIHEKTEFVIIWDYNGHWNDKLIGTDSQHDDQVRTHHFFSSGTPNVTLALSILNLGKREKIGQHIIDICDKLSEWMCDFQPDDHLLATMIISELISHARTVFYEQNNEAKVILCDSFLLDIDLLRSLAQAGCNIKMSLVDLSDVNKIKQLRDMLVREGKLELAFTVTATYNLDPEPVWAAWGLLLLKQGQFEAAKEKFKFCFTPRLSKIASSMYIENIVSALEMMPRGENSKKFGEDTLKIRFDQCVYYLTEYASSQLLIRFLIRNNKFEEAMQVFFKKDLSAVIFIDELFTFVLSEGKLPQLKAAIKKLDPTFEKSRDYLLAACSYFHKQNDFTMLLDLQEFMEDHARAGLTCIKLFVDRPDDAESKEKFLESAKTHFLLELKKIQNGSGGNFLSEIEINKYLKKLKLQKEIDLFILQLESVGLAVSIRNLSLFGNTKQRCELAEHLFEYGNADLAIGIVLAFQLPASKILTKVMVHLAKKEQLPQIEQLIQRGRDLIIKETEWDAFLLAAIKTLVTDLGLNNLGSKLAELLNSQSSKIDALIICGRLKSAYLEAVKISDCEKVAAIRDEALAKNQMTEFRLCEKYLCLSSTNSTQNPPD